METIRGRKSLDLNVDDFNKRLAGYHRILLDLGTGDGRYVHTLAENNPNWFVIGLDTCRENLREHSRAKLQNMLFIIASAQQPPRELAGRTAHVTINFPWGSLLESLLSGDPQLTGGLASLAGAFISMDMRLNAGALAEAGWTLEAGAGQIRRNMLAAGWQMDQTVMLDEHTLRRFPSTWAKRLAFGRDPRSVELSGWLQTSK